MTLSPTSQPFILPKEYAVSLFLPRKFYALPVPRNDFERLEAIVDQFTIADTTNEEVRYRVIRNTAMAFHVLSQLCNDWEIKPDDLCKSTLTIVQDFQWTKMLIFDSHVYCGIY